MVTRLTDELVAYQDGRYAARYRGLVDRVSLCEKSVSPHSTALTEAVARNLFRLMAYKDEYEVARLLSRPSFMERLNREFEGDFHLEFHLSIPLLERWSGGGSPPRKRRYGGWMLHAFRGLARLKVVRGTRFDPFGYTTERRLERALLQDYLTLLGELSAGLGPHNLDLALQLATLPDEIRGFGHVKHRNMNEVRTKRETLLAAFRATATGTASPTHLPAPTPG